MDGTNDVTSTFLAAGQIPGLINLGGGLPAPELFPAEDIARIAARVIRDHPQDCLGYSAINGLPDLRDALAARYSTGGVSLGRDNVLVTTSGMQALDLVGKVLLDPGDVVAGQHPTYLGAIDAWRPRSPRFRNMVLEPGFDAVAALEGAKFAYTVPNFSNPTGRLVPLAEREAILAAAAETGTWLVEDDPYGRLSYDGPVPPSLLQLSAAGRGGAYDGPVIHLGSMSKEISPGLRIGWMIAPAEMIARLNLAKQGSDMCTSGITQRIALAALEEGLIERIRPRALALYRERRAALLSALETHLSEWFTWERPEGGMFVWVRAKDAGFSTDALLTNGLDKGVCISPSRVFDAEGADGSAMRLNFTLNAPDKLEEGVARLARAVRAMV